jgi:hypothetical protein
VYLPRGYCDQPFLAVSHDEGFSWTRVQVSNLGMGRSQSAIWDHEAAVTADAAGNVYYTWVAHDRIPYLAVSRDRGQTWGQPIRLAEAAVNETSLPSMDIGPNGGLVIGYMGTTNSPGPPFDESSCALLHNPLGYLLNCPPPPGYTKTIWNGYLSMVPAPLSPAPAVTTVAVNPPGAPLVRGTCGPIRCQAEFDFIGTNIDRFGTPWGVFVDSHETIPNGVPIGEGLVARVDGVHL